jgi:demethylmenaquinone methyltransferase/2-methoxy-6-polyprenyl-1,4-benzoquinol methylase
VVITYLVTQTTTKAVKNLPEKVEKMGLLEESVRLSRMENFIELVASKPEEATK